MPDEQMPKVRRISTVVDYEDGTMFRIQVEWPESLNFKLTHKDDHGDGMEFSPLPEVPVKFNVQPPYGLDMQAKGSLDTRIHFWFPDMH